MNTFVLKTIEPKLEELYDKIGEKKFLKIISRIQKNKGVRQVTNLCFYYKIKNDYIILTKGTDIHNEDFIAIVDIAFKDKLKEKYTTKKLRNLKLKKLKQVGSTNIP